MVKWEYRTIKLETTGWSGGKIDETKLDEYMNFIGGEGWELVSAFDTNQTYGASKYVLAIFKRAKNS
jgi:hypothetical protein